MRFQRISESKLFIMTYEKERMRKITFGYCSQEIEQQHARVDKTSLFLCIIYVFFVIDEFDNYESRKNVFISFWIVLL